MGALAVIQLGDSGGACTFPGVQFLPEKRNDELLTLKDLFRQLGIPQLIYLRPTKIVLTLCKLFFCHCVHMRRLLPESIIVSIYIDEQFWQMLIKLKLIFSVPCQILSKYLTCPKYL